MMYIFAILFSLLGFSSLAAAANSVKLINHCPYDIWFWVAGPSKEFDTAIEDANHVMVPSNGGSVIHPMTNTELIGGGVSLKMRDMPYYRTAPAGIIQVEYHLEPTKSAMWYDLSAVDCDKTVGPDHPMYCPFMAAGMELHVPETLGNDCPPAFCRGSQCINTYLIEGGWKGEPSFKCWAGADLHIETCTEGKGPQTFWGKDPKVHIASGPPAQPLPPAQLITSTDETCGTAANTKMSGFTCTGSVYGACCSKWGYCGDTEEHCGAECQPGFGQCGHVARPNIQQPHPLPTITATIVSTRTSTAPADTVTSISTTTSTSISTTTSTSVFTSITTSTATSISTRVSMSIFTSIFTSIATSIASATTSTITEPYPTTTTLTETRTRTATAEITATEACPHSTYVTVVAPGPASKTITQYIYTQTPGPASTTITIPVPTTETRTIGIPGPASTTISRTVTTTSTAPHWISTTTLVSVSYVRETTTLSSSLTTVTETAISTKSIPRLTVIKTSYSTLPARPQQTVTETPVSTQPQQTVTQTSVFTQQAPVPVTSWRTSVTTEYVTQPTSTVTETATSVSISIATSTTTELVPTTTTVSETTTISEITTATSELWSVTTLTSVATATPTISASSTPRFFTPFAYGAPRHPHPTTTPRKGRRYGGRQ